MEPRDGTEGEWPVVGFGLPDSAGVAFDVFVRPDGDGLRVAIVREDEAVVRGVPTMGRETFPKRSFFVPRDPRNMRDRAQGEVTARLRDELGLCAHPLRRDDVATLVALQSAIDALVAADPDLAGTRIAGVLCEGLDRDALDSVVDLFEGLAAPRPR